MSYQTFVVHIIAGFNALLALVAANQTTLGITQPWVVLVGIPFAIWLGTYAANQMKAVGSSSDTK